MRLDVYLVQNGYAESRERARRLIERGAVLVGGVTVTKPAFAVEGTPHVTVSAAEPYVGRGGEKLAAALSAFSLSPAGLDCIDVGASTGGFTDCLLQHGAAHVTALDVGVGQLHPALRADPRVTAIEKYNARDLSPAAVGTFDLAVMDVSFISQTLILPRIPAVLNAGGALVSLIKPQFEAGRAALDKKGVVTDPRDRVRAVRTVLAAASAAGLSPAGLAPSPIKGGDGNEEFLAYFVKTSAPCLSELAAERVVMEKKVILP